MKKLTILAALFFALSLTGSVCDSPGGGGGGGGGLFSMGSEGGGSAPWDMVYVLQSSTVCEKSFPQSGAGILGLIPGGVFQGPIVSSSGYEYSGDIPEVWMLGYTQTVESSYEQCPDGGPEPPPDVQVLASTIGTDILEDVPVHAGDEVNVSFTYQANADGENGDFFLTRILDGNQFRNVAQAYYGSMAQNEPVNVSYTYISNDDGFHLEFMVGLSDPGFEGVIDSDSADFFYLDNLKVTVNGQEMFSDDFEEGDYSILVAPSPPDYYEDENQNRQCRSTPGIVARIPFTPGNPQGAMYLSDRVALEGEKSLRFMGGRYFLLDGQGATMDGVSGAALYLTDPDLEDGFFGDIWAAQQGSILAGDYSGWDTPVEAPDCNEEGMVLFASDLHGNADVSGNWTLRLDAVCEETTEPGVHLRVGETIGNTLGVARVLNAFIGTPFYIGEPPVNQNTQARQEQPVPNMIAIFAGLSMGDVAFMYLVSGDLGQQDQELAPVSAPPMAQMVGTYYPSIGVYSGQLRGVLPYQGGVCTIQDGVFTAIIDDSVFVEPPLEMLLGP